jgi:hypothetical protein
MMDEGRWRMDDGDRGSKVKGEMIKAEKLGCYKAGKRES